MEKIIKIDDFSSLSYVFGVEDKNVKFLEKELNIRITLKPEGVMLKGSKEKIEKASSLIKKISDLGKEGFDITQQDLKQYLGSAALVKDKSYPKDAHRPESEISIRVPSISKKLVYPKTDGQIEYINAMREYDIVFSTGPAGTGKTYLAMAMAVNLLMNKNVGRIILVRPAIEAGESLGFLPGDMREKLNPYLRPLYDALYDMMEVDVIEEYLEAGIIEIAPLAYMRGRTLNNAFVILDEAQNCTSEQLRMFLTRLGFDSKTVITGDLTSK